MGSEESQRPAANEDQLAESTSGVVSSSDGQQQQRPTDGIVNQWHQLVLTGNIRATSRAALSGFMISIESSKRTGS